jgi:hypothetical protein
MALQKGGLEMVLGLLVFSVCSGMGSLPLSLSCLQQAARLHTVECTHTDDRCWSSCMCPGVCVARFFLGALVWEPGQLEREILAGCW